jgi:hypothetical protein
MERDRRVREERGRERERDNDGTVNWSGCVLFCCWHDWKHQTAVCSTLKC